MTRLSTETPAPADEACTSGEAAEKTLKHNPKRQAWTFSSSGWLFVYHFGVVRALRELKKQKEVYAIGSSGGACAGSYVHLDADIDKTVEYVLGCAETARTSLRAAIDIPTYVRGAIERFAPDNAGELLAGNFEVSVTALPWLKNVRIKEFASKQALTQSVLASSCVMPGIPVWLDQHKVYGIDGGFSDLQILKGVWMGRAFFSFHMGDAISVCPFYFSRADITPSEYVPFWWAFFPPRREKLRRVYELGYRDAMNWLKEHHQVPLGVINGEHGADGQTSLRWWQAFQEASASARSCGDEFDEIFHESRTQAARLGWSLLACLVWLLVLLELGVMSLLSGLLLLLSPLLRTCFKDVDILASWHRFFSVSTSAASPWVVMKTIPAIGPRLDLQQHPRLQHELRLHSFFYRVFKPLLL